MKNKDDEETNYNIRNSSKQTTSNRTAAYNQNKTECSDIQEDKLELDNKYFNKFSELKPSCHNKLNRNIGEHFLLKDVQYSQSIKGICFTSNSGVNCTDKEENIPITTENNKPHNTQKHLNNGRNTKLTIREDINDKKNNNSIAHILTSNIKLYEDKTTYCRPVLNYYNQEFIYKTMERNSKLKDLVKKLSIARQREKEKVNWNNFINELKNKHRYDHDDGLLEEYVTPEIINDCCNTTFSWQKSRLCRNILQDFYDACDTSQPSGIHGRQQQPPRNVRYLPCNTNLCCYPTSSIGRLMMLRRGQGNNKYRCTNQVADKIRNSEGHAGDLECKCCVHNLHDYKLVNNIKNFKSSLAQVDDKLISPVKENIKKDKATGNSGVLFRNRSNETNYVDNPDYIKLENTNNSSLVNIENKLEYLIEAINSFMIQLKKRKRSELDIKVKTESYKTTEKINTKLNMTKSNFLAMREKDDKLLDEITTNDSGNTLTTMYVSPSDEHNAKINEILREVETCNKVDFQNQYKNNLKKPCSLQISIEIPTKDCCTEVTRSLSKQESRHNVVTIEDIITPERPMVREKVLPLQRMTIAVNTDPLSFLALLRFSTETLKRLMSYVPNFDYLSYLSALNFLQTSRAAETNYICKICGAAFDNPTKLSDHIHGHELAKTRDCCVCRHALERARTSLFSCQYCGQHFTRAYCCELHQQSCAKRLGKCHNVASSLILLR